MREILSMSKSTIKLLFRNIGFFIFFLIIPVVAGLLLNIKTDEKKEAKNIQILDSMDKQIAYLEDYSQFAIKVYDASGSKELVNEVLEGIEDGDIFQLFYIDVTGTSYEDIIENAKDASLNDRLGAIIILKDNFKNELCAGNISDSVEIYKCDDDDRFDLLISTVSNEFNTWSSMAALLPNATTSELIQAVKDLRNENISIAKEPVAVKNSTGGLEVNHKTTENLGYALIVLLLGFVLCGIMIVSTIINEKNNLVFTRILLTKTSTAKYLLSKFLVVLIMVTIQTVLAVTTVKFFVHITLDYTIGQFAAIIFTQGLIFSTLSVCVGMYFNTLMIAVDVSYVIWMLSALLGGMYFDISESTTTFKRVAMIMPERWAMKVADLFSQGSPKAVPLLLSVTAAYLIIILTAGAIGLRLSKKE